MTDSRGVAFVHQSMSFDSARRVSVGILFDSSSYVVDVGLESAVAQSCRRSRSIDSGLVADSECGGSGRTFGDSGPLSRLSVNSKSALENRSAASDSDSLPRGLTLSTNAAIVGSCDSGLLLREEDDDDAGVESVRSEGDDVVDPNHERLTLHRSSFDRQSKSTGCGYSLRAEQPPSDSNSDQSEHTEYNGDNCCGIVRISAPSSSSSKGASHSTAVATVESSTSSSASSSGDKCRQSSWLLRLFESKLFDMSIAIQYLFNSKELGVQSYLGNRLFTFPEADVDFFLPQLLTLYIYMHDVAEAVHPYLVHRCRSSVDFSIRTAWLLGAYAVDVPKPNWKNSQGVKLKNMILSEELRPGPNGAKNLLNGISNSTAASFSPRSKKTHHRSKSEATAAVLARSTSSGNVLSVGGDLLSGRAFDNGCMCHSSAGHRSMYSDMVGQPISIQCHCDAPRLRAQLDFISALMNIGKRLSLLPTKDLRTARLMAELTSLNLNLPSRVMVPVHATDHHVVRIPPAQAVVLNSKEKVLIVS